MLVDAQRDAEKKSIILVDKFKSYRKHKKREMEAVADNPDKEEEFDWEMH